MKYKIVHIVSNEKFIPNFVNFVNKNFRASEHLFLNINNAQKNKYPLPKSDNVIEFSENLNLHKNFFQFCIKISGFLKEADKIIVHGAFSGSLTKYLYFTPLIRSKAYWVMWGGDLYQPLISPAKTFKQKIHKFFDYSVRGRFAGYITYINGDYELAKKLYNASGKYHECIMYPSNLYNDLVWSKSSEESLTILVGNSADPTNNHEDIFGRLAKLKEQNFNIICPLSYGNQVHANKIKHLGLSMFGERFTALVDFMTLEQYLKLMTKVDIAVFAHKRQQAMGNTITLLGLGKTVYMRSDTTQNYFFKKLGIEVLDFDEFDTVMLTEKQCKLNRERVRGYFSSENLLLQLERVFNE